MRMVSLRVSGRALWFTLLAHSLYTLSPVAGQPASEPFGLVLDGQGIVGFVKVVSGGVIRAEVSAHSLGQEPIRKKRVTAVFPTPFQLEVDFDMTDSFFEWLRDSFEVPGTTRNGSLTASSPEIGAMNQRNFVDALITEVAFPRLDAGDSSRCFMSVAVAPLQIDYARSPSIVVPPPSPEKTWLCSNFRIEIGDLPTRSVTRIESFSLKQRPVADEVGRFREPSRHPTQLEVPNLKFTISTPDLAAWEEWHRSFVVDGRNRDRDEMNGRLVFLGPDSSQELGAIQFHHVGIISLEPAGPDPNPAQGARFEVELYVEEMRFTIP